MYNRRQESDHNLLGFRRTFFKNSERMKNNEKDIGVFDGINAGVGGTGFARLQRSERSKGSLENRIDKLQRQLPILPIFSLCNESE